jgi:hypothetical protein
VRIVALGASNLTRGLPSLLATARDRWGQDVEVVAALGLGRSYGTPSRIFVRTLPGILHSGLWQGLERLPPAPTRALVTDVGNDILYGFTPAQILAWVDECVARLLRITRDVVLTDLPMASLRRQPAVKLLTFRTVLWPQCRLSRSEILRRAEEVTAGLEALGSSRGLRFFRLRLEWYGFDPVHIRPGRWRAAWREILCGDDVAPKVGERMRLSEALRVYALMPERQRLLGLERVTPQAGADLPGGGRVWLF